MLCPQWCFWGYQEKCKACGKVWVETHQTSSKAVYNAFNNYDENATLAMFSFFPPACPHPENANDTNPASK